MLAEKQCNETAASELREWTAAEAIQYILFGSITAERSASQLLERYRTSKQLNAITWIDENRVLEVARAVDAARSKGGPRLGQLAGLPIVWDRTAMSVDDECCICHARV